MHWCCPSNLLSSACGTFYPKVTFGCICIPQQCTCLHPFSWADSFIFNFDIYPYRTVFGVLHQQSPHVSYANPTPLTTMAKRARQARRRKTRWLSWTLVFSASPSTLLQIVLWVRLKPLIPTPDERGNSRNVFRLLCLVFFEKKTAFCISTIWCGWFNKCIVGLWVYDRPLLDKPGHLWVCFGVCWVETVVQPWQPPCNQVKLQAWVGIPWFSLVVHLALYPTINCSY